MVSDNIPVKWWIGPPAPRAFTIFTRLLGLSTFILISVWVFGYLGGVKGSPKVIDEGKNDTGQLFNWHPLLMSIAFPILMAEALLAYRAPITGVTERSSRKSLHWVAHSLAVILVDVSVFVAFQSHNLKLPVPTPNLYSTHSILGLAVLTLLNLQWIFGVYSYLAPQISLAQRKALGPVHSFVGRLIFVAGLATMAVGIQEKSTFLQTLAKVDVYSPTLRLPALIQLFLLLSGAAVLYHHVEGDKKPGDDVNSALIGRQESSDVP